MSHSVARASESPRSENLQIVQIGTSLRPLSSAQSVFFDLATQTGLSRLSLCPRQWGHSADRLRGLHVDEIAWNHHSIETNTNMKAGQRGRASEMLYVRVALLYTISYSSPLLHCLARFLPWSVHLQVSLFGAWWPLRLWNHVQQSFVEFCDWLGLTMPGDKKGVKYLGFGDTLAGASLKLFVFVSKM